MRGLRMRQFWMTVALGALGIPAGAGEPGDLPSAPRAGSSGVDLADIVGGGDGSGTGAAQGINPYTGLVETQQPSAIEGPFNDYVRTSNPWVDGVFVPDGSSGPVEVTSTGILASGIPTGISTFPPYPSYHYIWNYPNGTFSYAPSGDRSPRVLGMHASKGITFDLDAIEGRYEQQIRGFEAIAAMSQPFGLVEFQVLVDGARRFRWVGTVAGASRRARFEIGEDERFVTLIASSLGSTNGDHSYFGNPTLRFTPPSAAGYVLPAKASVRFSSNPANTRVDVAGTLDLGADPTTFAGPVVMTVAGREIELPSLVSTAAGRRLTFRDAGTSLRIVRGAGGTSRSTFVLRLTGPFDGLTREGALDVRFDDGYLLADGRANLIRGKFRLAKPATTLEAPDLSLLKLRATLDTASGDRCDATLRIPTSGIPPTANEDVTVAVGAFSQTLVASAFSTSGSRRTWRGTSPGVTSLVLDYAKGTAVLKVQGVEIGDVPAGASPLRIALAFGTERRAVEVVGVRKGASYRY